MNLEEMKKTWKQQKPDKNSSITEEEIMMLLRKKMDTYDHKVTKRDRMEISVAVLMIIGCSIYLFFTDSVWHQLACVTGILSCLLITYRLISAKQTDKKDYLQPDVSVRAHLLAELEKVQNQKRLLESVLWWYLLPLFASIFLFVMGFNSGVTMKLIIIIGNALLYAYIWRMNQQAVAKNILPLINEIEESLATVDSAKA